MRRWQVIALLFAMSAYFTGCDTNSNDWQEVGDNEAIMFHTNTLSDSSSTNNTSTNKTSTNKTSGVIGGGF